MTHFRLRVMRGPPTCLPAVVNQVPHPRGWPAGVAFFLFTIAAPPVLLAGALYGQGKWQAF